MTAIQPGGRFGVLDIDHSSNPIIRFVEKAKEASGFMVANPSVFDYIDNKEDTIFEKTLESHLQAYKHTGFWQCMDTQRDKAALEVL